jgi:hypothetical protein
MKLPPLLPPILVIAMDLPNNHRVCQLVLEPERTLLSRTI